MQTALTDRVRDDKIYLFAVLVSLRCNGEEMVVRRYSTERSIALQFAALFAVRGSVVTN